VIDVLLGACEEVIQCNDFVACGQQSFAEKGTKKTGSSGDKGAFSGGEHTVC